MAKAEKTNTGEDSEPKLAYIELLKLESNPWQPRVSAPTDEELGDLINSIKAVGQQTPGRARPHPKKSGIYQIADGAMRRAALGKLGKKSMLLVIESLTDRQMKILALAQNVFVRLPDGDKRTAVYKLWESEFKTDEPSAKGGKRDAEFTGIREMERETGMSHVTILGHLDAYTAQELVGNRPTMTKAEKAALKEVSSYDLQAVAAIAKESPKVAAELIKARQTTDDEAPVLKASELREAVKQIQAAPVQKRDEAVKQLIEGKEEARTDQRRREKELADAARVARERAEQRAEQDKKTAAQRARDEQSEREDEERKRAQDAVMTRQKLAKQVADSVTRAVGALAQAIGGIEQAFKSDNLRPALQYDEFAAIVRERKKEVKALTKRLEQALDE